MNEEIMHIRGWVHDALKCAVNERNKKQKVSEYDRGRIAGIISAYQQVMVETSPLQARKIQYNALERCVSNITINTPLRLTDAIGICHFCDINDMLSLDNTIDIVIALGNMDFDSYEIKAILDRRKYDE